MRRTLFSICCILLTSTTFAQTAEPSSSWPTFRGSAGDGRVAEGLPEGEGQVGFDLTWKRQLGSGYAGVSIADGRLVTAMAAGERDVVVALDATSGDEIWRYDLAPAYTGHDGSHDGPISTPAIVDGRVFALSPWGRLVALALADGKEIWSTHLKEDLGVDPPFYGYGSSPGVAQGVVALQVGGEGGKVFGFDADSGEVRWRALEGGDIGTQSPIPTTLAGKEQFVVLSEERVNGLDPASGDVLWEVALEGDSGAKGAFSQSPVPIGGDRLLIKHKTEVSEVVRVSKGESGFNAEVEKESRGLSNSYSPPAVGGEGLFGYTSLFLSAMDAETGDLLWRSREPGDGFLIAIEDQLAVLTKTGSLHLGKASREGWRGGAQIELFEDLAWTPPSFADGAVFVRSLGELARVDLVRRERISSGDTPPEPPKSLAPLLAKLTEAEDAGKAYEAFLGERELPLVNGDEVIFLWHGEAEDVAIAGDMIGMRREEPMFQAEGTHLWWWSTNLPPQARIRYALYVDYELIVDPRQPRTTPSTLLGPDMNWNRGEPMPMSWFAMPQWPGLEAAKTSPEGEGNKGRLETIELTVQPPTPDDGEAPEAVQVTTHVWLPPGYDESSAEYPVVYVHNPGALEVGDWQQALDQVVGQCVQPLITVFPVPPRVRGFGALFASQVVDQIDERYRTVTSREGRANVGMAWNSQTVAALTFENPERFGKLGIQSAFLLESLMDSFEEAMGDATAETLPLDIYLEWGRWDLDSPHEEMDLRASAKWTWDLLREKGWEPIGGEVWDTTDFGSWSQRTDLLLQALFPGEAVDNRRLKAWQTGR